MSMCIEKKEFCGNDLLPQIEKVSLEKARALSRTLTIITQEAISALIEKRWSDFDAPVGDNSCKIRAGKIVQIALRSEREIPFQCEVSLLTKHLLEISRRIPCLEWPAGSKETLSLREFRKRGGVEFPISSDLLFLVQCYFLLFVRKTGTYDQTDPSKLMGIASSTAKNWIHAMKVQVAISSVEFVRNEVKKTPENRLPILSAMLSDPFVRTYEKRPVLTNMHSMEVIFTRALQEKLLVVLKTPFRSILWSADEKGEAFEEKKLTFADLQRPAIVIQGTLSRDIEFSTEDFLGQLLTRAAQDCQYLEGDRSEPIAFHDDVRDEERRYESLKRKPLSFTIHHILCDRIGRHMHLPIREWHSCSWLGDDLNVEPGSWKFP